MNSEKGQKVKFGVLLLALYDVVLLDKLKFLPSLTYQHPRKQVDSRVDDEDHLPLQHSYRMRDINKKWDRYDPNRHTLSRGLHLHRGS